MNILILSPHRDDAACSLGLAIMGWLAASNRVTILGVFTRSLNAPFSDSDTVHPNDLLSYVSAMRRREDAELLKLMPGLRMVDLNLKDAPLRLRCSAAELYTLAPSLEDTAIPKIQKALAKLHAEQPIEAILLPLGLGHHVDHLVVRNAAIFFAAARASAFYEDLPDAFRSASEIDEAAWTELEPLRQSGSLARDIMPKICGPGDSGMNSLEAAESKRQIASIYASQIDHATIETISNFAGRYGGGERVWGNPAWLYSGL